MDRKVYIRSVINECLQESGVIGNFFTGFGDPSRISYAVKRGKGKFVSMSAKAGAKTREFVNKNAISLLRSGLESFKSRAFGSPSYGVGGASNPDVAMAKDEK
jgi:hypothetical protein